MCAMCTYNAYSDNNLLGAYRTMILAGWILAPLRNGAKLILKLNLKLYDYFTFQKLVKKENSKSSKVAEKIDVPEETNKDKDIEGETDGSHLEIEESILPKWLTRYLQFRFDLLDRTGKS